MDARVTERCELDLPATIATAGQVLACRVVNLSVGGAYVTGAQLALGDRATLVFHARSLPPIEASCVARWIDERGCGLEFVGLAAGESAALGRLVRAENRQTARLRPTA